MIKYLQLLVLLLGVQICLGQHGELKAFTVPLVKEKSYTSLLRMTVVVDREPLFLQQLHLDFQGTTRLSDIGTVQVYASEHAEYLTADKTAHSAFFARATTNGLKGSQLALKGNLRLKKGTHYIWLGMSPSWQAPIGNKIALTVSQMRFNGSMTQRPPAGPPHVFRIASAVRQTLQDHVHTSRIPGLATAANGDLLAIFDARFDSKRDLQGDIDIGLNRSKDKGNTWLPLQRVIDLGTYGGLPEKFNGVSDPCILVDDRSGTIFIAGLWMHGVLDPNGHWIEGLSDTSTQWNHQWRNKGSQPGFDPKQTAQFLIVKSTDHGRTWSKPLNLTTQCKKKEWWLWAPAPGRGITLTDGTLVFPTQGRDQTGKAFSNITYSKDHGKTWHTSNRALNLSTTECMAAQLSDGSIMLNMRTNANKGLTGEGNGRAVAVTRDLGVTWTEHPSSRKALPEPVCMASLYRHDYTGKDGKATSVLLFLNPNSKTARNRITLKVSFDDGHTWPPENFILLDELKGSGYSCITSVDERTIGLIYEGSQANLVFEKIDLNEIIKGL